MGSNDDRGHVPRTCPACTRTWGSDATFCGACGALLDPAEATSTAESGAMRRRRGPVVATVLAVAVGAVLAVPRVDLPALGGDDVEDDDIALPTEVEGSTATAPPGPERQEVSCTRARVPVDDCVLWRADATRAAPGLMAVREVGILLASGDATTVARDLETGEVRWERDDLGTPVYPLLVTDEVVAVVGRDGQVRGLAVADGTQRWAFRGVSLALGPSATDDILPVGLPSSHDEGPTGLAALDPDDGSVLWEWAAPWSGRIQSVAVTPDAVLAAGAGRLARLAAATGETTWVVDTVADAYLQYTPPDVVAAQGPTGDLPADVQDDAGLALHDATTGEVIQRLPGADLMDHVVVDGVVVVHRPRDGTIQGLELGTGDLLWTRPLEGRGSLGTARGPAPMVVVMERDADRVRRLDPRSGEPVWQADLPRSTASPNSSAFLGQPVLAGPHVVVEDENSLVTVLDADDGRQLVSLDGGVGLDVRSVAPLVVVQAGQVLAVDVDGGGTGTAGQ